MVLKSVIAGSFLALAIGGGAAAQEQPTQATPETPAVEVPKHVHGDIIYGSKDAPVEIVEYASMTCPHCKTFNDTVLPYLKENLIPNGKVKLVFRNFVRDRADLAVAVLTRCTDDPEKSKVLIATYFERQEEWLHASQPGIAIQSIANFGGVDFDRITECGNSREIAEHLIEMRQMGIRHYEINSVPTILINGTKVQFKGYEELREKIELATIGK